jgi:hypothetical protein
MLSGHGDLSWVLMTWIGTRGILRRPYEVRLGLVDVRILDSPGAMGWCLSLQDSDGLLYSGRTVVNRGTRWSGLLAITVSRYIGAEPCRSCKGDQLMSKSVDFECTDALTTPV